MKILVKTILIALLGMNALTATYGGLNLMLIPNGSGLGLPLELLSNTPFDSYFLPGLILLLSNGLSSIFIGWIFLTHSRHSYWMVNAQGFMLVTYIVVQVMMIDVIVPLHLICGGAGMLMILLGSFYEQLLKGRKKKLAA
ncbi:hypothetical protein AAEO56_11960 [Flavobacterium sp. DGU11]|uniref:DUF4386 domain-containing protein n=1 Tax=Flavobacterium arundinis TaxID=3139143 RepID=A0ABU9HXU1_9FLAO